MIDVHEHFTHWFPGTMSDETAHAIHLFLDELNLAFHEHYYTQIMRHIDRAKREYQLELPLDPPPHSEDDQIPF